MSEDCQLRLLELIKLSVVLELADNRRVMGSIPVSDSDSGQMGSKSTSVAKQLS